MQQSPNTQPEIDKVLKAAEERKTETLDSSEFTVVIDRADILKERATRQLESREQWERLRQTIDEAKQNPENKDTVDDGQHKLREIEQLIDQSITQAPPAPPEEPAKEGWERTWETLKKTVNDWMSKIGTGGMKALKTVMGWLGLKEFSVYLDQRIQTSELRDLIARELKVKTESRDDDGEKLNLLKAQYQTKIRESNGTLSEATYTLDHFCRERLALMKQDNAVKPIMHIADIVAFKSTEQLRTERENADADIARLKEAGATSRDGTTWTVALDLGDNIHAVNIRKTNGSWEWQTDNDTEWQTEKFALDGADLTDDQKANRQKMNTLGAALSIKKQAETTETPASKPRRHIVALAEAFNKLAGEKVVVIDAQDTWEDVAAKLRNAFINERFDRANIKLEIDGGNLEATDTHGRIWGSDHDILEGWDTLLQSDPVAAVEAFMRLDPNALGLDSESSNAIFTVKNSLKNTLKDLPR